jgi:hypothetical protein
MRRIKLSGATFFIMAGVLLAGCIHAAGPALVRDSLEARFQASRVEVQDRASAGRVLTRGAVLILQADHIPAKQFRVFQDMTKSPRLHHLPDYARVELAPDGRLTAAPGDFLLTQGTRLVVLDLKVNADRVHLWTHTLEPGRLATGEAVYGCTEFVFLFDAGTLERGDLFAIQSRIEQWLPRASATQSAASL